MSSQLNTLYLFLSLGQDSILCRTVLRNDQNRTYRQFGFQLLGFRNLVCDDVMAARCLIITSALNISIDHLQPSHCSCHWINWRENIISSRDLIWQHMSNDNISTTCYISLLLDDCSFSFDLILATGQLFCKAQDSLVGEYAVCKCAFSNAFNAIMESGEDLKRHPSQILLSVLGMLIIQCLLSKNRL